MTSHASGHRSDIEILHYATRVFGNSPVIVHTDPRGTLLRVPVACLPPSTDCIPAIIS